MDSRLFDTLVSIEKKHSQLCELLAFPEIVADNRYWSKLSAECSALEPIAQKFQSYLSILRDNEALACELAQTSDSQTKQLIEQLTQDNNQTAQDLAEQLRELVLENQFEHTDAVVEVKALDSSDACVKLFDGIVQMYQNYAKNQQFECEIDSSTAGKIKSACLVVSGFSAFSKLQHENGVHKCTGDKANASVVVTVYAKPAETLALLDDKDIRTDIFHSGGPGGQNVNKVESAVRLTHLPTGISVTCRNERSQLQNRSTALKLLQEKLFEHTSLQRKKALAHLRKQQHELATKNQRIRTYNFLLDTVTDHRTETTLDLFEVFSGKIDEFINAQLLSF